MGEKREGWLDLGNDRKCNEIWVITSMNTSIAALLLVSNLMWNKKNLELQIWVFMVKGGETEQLTMLNFSTLRLQGKHVFFNLSGLLWGFLNHLLFKMCKQFGFG